MTMLLTESNLLVNDTTTRKKRRMAEEFKQNDMKDDTTPLTVQMINPVTQQYIRPNMVAPDFNCAAIFNGEYIRLQLSSLLGTYQTVVLFFYECDFTPTSCRDLNLINNNFKRFQSLNTIPIAISTDSDLKQKAVVEQYLPSAPLFPVAIDITRSLSRYFKVINSETGVTQRAAFVIDKTRQVRFSFLVQDRRLNYSIDTICTIIQTM